MGSGTADPVCVVPCPVKPGADWHAGRGCGHQLSEVQLCTAACPVSDGEGSVRAVLFSVMLPVAATVLVWLWLTGGHDPAALLRLAAEPFQVARTSFLLRGGDVNLMDVLDPVFTWRV